MLTIFLSINLDIEDNNQEEAKKMKKIMIGAIIDVFIKTFLQPICLYTVIFLLDEFLEDNSSKIYYN